MATGSFWTQPRGGVHVTAEKGTNAMAYIEIEEGPYLVRPVEEAFRSEARPVNVDAFGVVWVNASEIRRSAAIDAASPADGAQIAFLRGNPEDGEPGGLLVKLRAGATCVVQRPGSTFHAIVIQGSPGHQAVGGLDSTVLRPGSYIGATRASARISCGPGEDCILYVRTQDRSGS